ncbi:HTH-type transcriptional regulator/antitoxin HipB [Nocardioides cavernae]|uniref:HTH-type transcriptional regulator/antitoxin HipB n=1 Tax=Nocardioides cavernae TaxID=1921566 RepID=A0A7Y9GZ75_9ACTN|nr:helix-turn-helix domain-containing protein [Nocardioides cavernae]NYE35061.1 HTH-type transcriptional regulator/antitoxin HipB [Nocardioides cavernae]
MAEQRGGVRGGEDDGGSAWDVLPWTEAEKEWWAMGPFPGGVPGLVRRIRRILDLSQRGLAELLDVSQSAVARWETGRTSPRVSMMQLLLDLAGLEVTVRDGASGEVVEGMRDDGARDRGGRRYPAHTDLRVTGWWLPRAMRTWTSAHALEQEKRSRRAKDPGIGYRTSQRWKDFERTRWGVPDDHPALHQLVAEMEWRDEVREEWRRMRRGAWGEGGPTSLLA